MRLIITICTVLFMSTIAAQASLRCEVINNGKSGYNDFKYCLSWKTSNKQILVMTGGFGKDLTKNIIKLHKYYAFTTMIMSSTGGRATEGLMLHDFIADNKIKIIVNRGSYCLSACALAIMGSPNIIMDGLIGFHPANTTRMPQNITIDAYIKNLRTIDTQTVTRIVTDGYSIGLYIIINKYGNRDTFVVFYSGDALHSFKTTQDRGVGEVPVNFYKNFGVLSGAESNEYIKRQQYDIKIELEKQTKTSVK